MTAATLSSQLGGAARSAFMRSADGECRQHVPAFDWNAATIFFARAMSSAVMVSLSTGSALGSLPKGSFDGGLKLDDRLQRRPAALSCFRKALARSDRECSVPGSLSSLSRVTVSSLKALHCARHINTIFSVGKLILRPWLGEAMFDQHLMEVIEKTGEKLDSDRPSSPSSSAIP